MNLLHDQIQPVGLTFASCRFLAQIDAEISEPVRIRTSRAGLSIFGAKGSSLAAAGGFRSSMKLSGGGVFTELLAFYPPACIIDVSTGVADGGDMDGEAYVSVQVHPRQVLSVRETLAPQMPYLDVSKIGSGSIANPGAESSASSSDEDEEAGGVGLHTAINGKPPATEDYEQALADAYPWLWFGELETPQAMQSLTDAVEKHAGGLETDDADAFAARRCYDPAVLTFWASAPGSRVVRFCRGLHALMLTTDWAPASLCHLFACE